MVKIINNLRVPAMFHLSTIWCNSGAVKKGQNLVEAASKRALLNSGPIIGLSPRGNSNDGFSATTRIWLVLENLSCCDISDGCACLKLGHLKRVGEHYLPHYKCCRERECLGKGVFDRCLVGTVGFCWNTRRFGIPLPRLTHLRYST